MSTHIQNFAPVSSNVRVCHHMKRGGKKTPKTFCSALFILCLLARSQSAPKSFHSKREEELTNCLFSKLQMSLTPEADVEPDSALSFFLLLWPVSQVWDDFHHFYSTS